MMSVRSYDGFQAELMFLHLNKNVNAVKSPRFDAASWACYRRSAKTDSSCLEAVGLLFIWPTLMLPLSKLIKMSRSIKKADMRSRIFP